MWELMEWDETSHEKDIETNPKWGVCGRLYREFAGPRVEWKVRDTEKPRRSPPFGRKGRPHLCASGTALEETT